MEMLLKSATRLKTKHVMALVFLVLQFLWMMGATYFLVEKTQLSPLVDRVTLLRDQVDEKDKDVDIFKAKANKLEDNFNSIQQQRNQPALLSPANEQDIISSQLNFSWSYAGNNEFQRYILEMRNLDDGKDYSFNVTNLGLESMHVPVYRVGYGEFLWRVTPGHRFGDVDLVQGGGSNYSLFRVFSSAWRKVLKKREILVATTPKMSGVFARVSANNELVGFDIDLIKWVIDEINYKENLDVPIKVSFVSLPWDQLLPKLRDQEVDIVVSSMTATKEREVSFNVVFSEKYFRAHELFVVKKTPVNGFPDGLKGGVVGVIDNTTSESTAIYLSKIYGFKVNSKFKYYGDMLKALEAGEINFVVADKVDAMVHVNSEWFEIYGPDLDEVMKEFYKESFGHEEQYYAFALRRELSDELLNKINEIILSPRGQAKLSQLEKRWVYGA
ncbi:ABC-type amino acid transport substrate-binding protein [Sinobacterium caligoides]|uniref:ABC-type amino acid transport substrate-binding protein n=1 Tax=Sinobacterium caligoides TaxID=933926 RepID=A0A3N2DYE1_9GAMM|nr:ABC transporter substrate-binding protein [Sinobacterium caligoides]ROS04880.1 ABC-type amino acid transport substrate-binding protein [Sinobacterium caligoides]